MTIGPFLFNATALLYALASVVLICWIWDTRQERRAKQQAREQAFKDIARAWAGEDRR